jgi:acetyltransferase-like isoleucine patch superfamily enzyme
MIPLDKVERWLTSFLLQNADRLPPRWRRWLASYYPDAEVRRLCWQQTHVEMGEGTFANIGMVVVDDYTSGECLLSFGERVSIAPNVVFAPYSLPNNSPAMLADPEVGGRLMKRLKIMVEDDVWIGAHATILAGVRIGAGAVIGAGTVVVKDVPPRTIVAGVPGRVVRELGRS